MLLLLSLLSCSREGGTLPPLDTARTDTGTPLDGDSSGEVVVEIPAPTLSAAAVGAAIAETLGEGIPSPFQPRTVFLGLFAHRDPTCPGGESYTLPGRFQGCTAASGWLYAGIATYAGPIEPGDLRSFAALGDCYIISPEDDWFIGAGELSYTQEGIPEGGQWRGAIAGRWSYPQAEGWMAHPEASATLDSEVFWGVDSWSLRVEGSLYDGSHALRLDALRAQSQQCGGKPTGTIGLRGADGYWYDLTLDCGCGPVVYADGQDLGEVCIDIAAPLETLAREGIP